jgi:hypothetical protein
MTHNAFSNPGAGRVPADDRPFARCGFAPGTALRLYPKAGRAVRHRGLVRKIDRERHSCPAGAEAITLATGLGELSFAHCRWHVARVLAQAFRDCGNAFGLERAAVSTSIPDRKRPEGAANQTGPMPRI